MDALRVPPADSAGDIVKSSFVTFLLQFKISDESGTQSSNKRYVRLVLKGVHS